MAFTQGTQAAPVAPNYVRYDRFTSLNTKADPHVITRQQLQASVNMWNQSALVIGKRPGSTDYTTAGATGSAAAGLDLAVARSAAGVSFALVLSTNGGNTNIWWGRPTDSAFTKITTNLTGGVTQIHAAQMFDPDNAGSGVGQETVFICDGTDVPQMWVPGATTLASVATGAGKLPTNRTNAASITPTLVNQLMGQLFYAGEPTEPDAVYISDVFFPERFTSGALLTAGIVQGAYVPYLIGRNDGIDGGNITAIEPLGNAMLVYKQSAIYRMDYGMRLFGDTVWSVSIVSTSTGCLSPHSVVRYDGFHTFLGIDGVYMTDGTTFGTRKISENVPSYFDGANAQILNRQNAIAARLAAKYLIWYDDGNGTGVATGYPTRGAWFDFNKPDEDGYPSSGEIVGMTPAGVGELRGPKDVGQIVWCNATADQVGAFPGNNGQALVYSDFGTAIQSTVQGKSDWFDEFNPGAPQKMKQVQNIALLLSLPSATFNTSLTFNAQLTGEFTTDASASAQTYQIPSGTALVLPFTLPATFGGSGIPYAYQRLEIPSPQSGQGRTVSWTISESSVNPWNLLGIEVDVNPQPVSSVN